MICSIKLNLDNWDNQPEASQNNLHIKKIRSQQPKSDYSTQEPTLPKKN
jgi:hypothetical protein